MTSYHTTGKEVTNVQKRKTIAVIAADVANDYMNRILVGISEQSKVLGYDVYAFIMTFSTDGDSLIQYGEENVFSLIRPDVIDGIILLAGNFPGQSLVERIEDKIKTLGIPMLSVDYDFPFCESIYAEDSRIIEEMTDYLIDYHGCSKLICLTGPEGNTPAMSRLKGFMDSMEKHGLEVNEENIVYGDFWKPAAQRLANEIAGGKRPVPDAIVCANDVMAMNLCNALISGGIKVPDQVRITGYDGSRDAIENIPSISTVYPENSHLGASAVCRIHEMITGEKAEPSDTKTGSLILAQSCGCSDGLTFLVRKREFHHKNVERYENFYNKSGMMEGLMVAENLEDLLKKIDDFAYVLNGIDTYMLCLCKNWDDFDDENDNNYITDGYSEKMEVRMVINDNTPEYINYEYDSVGIIPPLMKKYSAEPSVYFVFPVHFMDRCFGYSLIKFTDIRLSVSMVFAHWNRNINIALEFLRVRTKLMSMNQRISMSSIRDTLTGIYNRKGFKRLSDAMFKKAQTEKQQFLIMMADLDMLKHINDNFGHIEGDNAITVAANALNTCCKNSEICCRIGGDEYAIVGVGEYTDDIISDYFMYIEDYCDRYNSTSGKGYKVGVSLGFYCDVPDETMEIDHFINIADERMYENKFNRKKNRQ